MNQEGIVCPECSTLNEIGWSFCQQCGKRLVQPQPPPQSNAHPPAQVPAGLATNPEQEAVDEPTTPQSPGTFVAKPSQPQRGIKTVAEKSSPEKGLKTVSDKPGAFEDDLKTVRDAPPRPDQGSERVGPKPPVVDHESKTARQDAGPSEPEAPIEPSTEVAPTNLPVPAQPPATKPRPPAVPPPVEAQGPPPQAKPAAPPRSPATQKPAAPPRDSTPEQSTQPSQSGSGVLCIQCGHSTGVGSAFCPSCGAPVTYGETTMVISSEPPPPPTLKGRLHLVMEGGQAGDVYELDDETVIGRSNGEITFPHDGFMSGRHARIERRGTRFILTDEGSRNGTFVKIKGEIELNSGDTILVGKQLFRFEV